MTPDREEAMRLARMVDVDRYVRFDESEARNLACALLALAADLEAAERLATENGRLAQQHWDRAEAAERERDDLRDTYHAREHFWEATKRDLATAREKIAELEQSVKTVIKEDGVVVSRQAAQLATAREALERWLYRIDNPLPVYDDDPSTDRNAQENMRTWAEVVENARAALRSLGEKA